MGRLTIYEQDGTLELEGFPLHIGDQVQTLHLGDWVSGSIARDRQGAWHILTAEGIDIRLQTGFIASLLSLSSETETHTAVQAQMLGNTSPLSSSNPSAKWPNRDLSESRGRIAVPRKCSLLAVSDTTQER